MLTKYFVSLSNITPHHWYIIDRRQAFYLVDGIVRISGCILCIQFKYVTLYRCLHSF